MAIVGSCQNSIHPDSDEFIGQGALTCELFTILGHFANVSKSFSQLRGGGGLQY